MNPSSKTEVDGVHHAAADEETFDDYLEFLQLAAYMVGLPIETTVRKPSVVHHACSLEGRCETQFYKQALPTVNDLGQ